MAIYYQDPSATLHLGDALDALAVMEPESVHAVVTSPPYWGLRKYAGEQERTWGGVKGHEHESGCVCGAWRGSVGLEPLHDCMGWARGERCSRCYVCHTLAFLDALWRVLRRDGVVFWIIGDGYSAGGREGHGTQIGYKRQKDMVLMPQRVALAAQAAGWWVRSMIVWAKPNPFPESTEDRPTSSYEHVLMLTKNAGTPLYWTHRDLQGTREQPAPDYRWQRRRTLEPDSSWHGSAFDGERDQAVYEAVGTRPRAFEILQERDTAPEGWSPKNKMGWERVNLWEGHDYYFDMEAVKKTGTYPAGTLGGKGSPVRASIPGVNSRPPEYKVYDGYRHLRDVWTIATEPTRGVSVHGRHRTTSLDCPIHGYQAVPGFSPHISQPEWTTEEPPDGCSCQYTGKVSKRIDHFAGFPEALPDLCIRAATSEHGACPACGAPWIRQTEYGEPLEAWKRASGADSHGGYQGVAQKDYASAGAEDPSAVKARILEGMRQTVTIAWRPSCTCDAGGPIPATVLDPFAGSGTTLAMAKRLGRRSVGVELSADYCILAVRRIEAETAAML